MLGEDLLTKILQVGGERVCVWWGGGAKPLAECMGGGGLACEACRVELRMSEAAGRAGIVSQLLINLVQIELYNPRTCKYYQVYNLSAITPVFFFQIIYK